MTKAWKDYYKKVILFDLETIVVMCICSVIFDNWTFAIIASFIMNFIRKYTYGFHFKNLYFCTIFTNIIFILFGYMAKSTIDCLWIPLLLSFIAIKDLWLKSPLKDMDKPYEKRWYHRAHLQKMIKFLHINTQRLDIPYDKEYCQRHLGKIMFILGIFCLICLYFNMNYILSCILWSIISTDLLCFVNDSKW